MGLRIRSPRDLGAATVFILAGATGLWLGRVYTVGTAARMGPGYLPMVLSWLLLGFGVVLAVRALAYAGPALEPVRWRSLVLVLVAIAVFALLVARAGFAPAVLGAALVAAWSTAEARGRESIALAALLTVFCVAVFVFGLRLPFSILNGL